MNISAADSGTIKIGEFTVNRLGFGAMRLTGEGIWGEPSDRQEAIRVLKRAAELGVNFIDTADAYGPEVSENLIYEALHPYNGLVIATKGGLTRQGPGIWTPDGRPEHLHEALEASLKRLGVEAIDIYQFHRPDPNVPFEESIEALTRLKQAGKIKHIGLSNVTLEQIKAAQAITEIVSIQNRYNITAKADSEGIVRYCEEQGLAFIPYFPIGGNDGGQGLEALQSIANKHQATVRQVALAWLLGHSPAILPIPGTSSIAHLEENIAAASLKLGADDITQLDSVSVS